MKKIKLTKGMFALVDDDDFEKVSKYNWCYFLSHSGNEYAKARIRLDGEDKPSFPVLLHRFVMNLIRSSIMVDHKDRNGLNNQKSNLRICDNQKNQWNSKPKGLTSKYKGVYFNKNASKWHSRIVIANKRVHLGFFDDEQEAARAYDKQAKLLHGEFVVLNFP